MKCPYCKAPMVEEEQAYIVQLEDGVELRLDDVPTWVCEICDHTKVEDDVIDTINDMLDHLDTFGTSGEEE